MQTPSGCTLLGRFLSSAVMEFLLKMEWTLVVSSGVIDSMATPLRCPLRGIGIALTRTTLWVL